MRITNMVWLSAAILGGLISIGPVAEAQRSGRADVALEAAAKKETVDGDLKGAIELYQKIISQFANTDRAAAGRALVRMGQCYEKMGSAEARKAYERAVREFADQNEVASAARARLAALGIPKSGMAYRQVWAGHRLGTHGTVSPDGRYLSYADWDSGELLLHQFATNSDRHLTNTGKPDWAQESAISRDGKQVAYAWYRDKTKRYELRIVNLQTPGVPEPRLLFENEDVYWIPPYDWSPDGKWIAVALERKSGTHEIGLISVQDGSLTVLKSYNGGLPRRIAFSPDSKYLGFDLRADDKAESDIIVRAVQDNQEVKVFGGPSENTMMAWSPDGKRLLFASDRSGATSLWEISMEGDKPQGTPIMIRPDIGANSLGVTASGALYTLTTISDRDIRVASLDLSTGTLRSAQETPVQSFLGHNGMPDWSPDGLCLAYLSQRPGQYVLAIRSMETGQVRELRPNLRLFNFPRWAPNGHSLVVMGIDLKGRQGIYGINFMTGDASPIAIAPNGSWFLLPEYSPDGQKIYYLNRFTNTDESALVERDLASGSEREVFRRSRLGQPSISPDGRSVAARSYDPSSKCEVLQVIPIAGGEPRNLLRVNAPETLSQFLTWAPDGRDVLVQKMVSANRDRTELWLIPVAGGQPRKLQFETGRGMTIARIHPDGRQIAYIAGDMKSEVWVLENFLPAAKTSK